MKRKRKPHGGDIASPVKRTRREIEKTVEHCVLGRYYRRVLSLREYLVEALPTTSKHRKNAFKRRKAWSATIEEEELREAHNLLDTVLVCSVQADDSKYAQIQPADHLQFSQQVAGSSVTSSLNPSQKPSQAEVRKCLLATQIRARRADL